MERGSSLDNEDDGQALSLDKLYPLPSKGVPLVLLPPAVTPVNPTSSDTAAARVLQRVLRHNREHHHAYIKNKWFHNHAAHHMVAIFALGASSQLIERAYGAYDNLTPAYESPESITDSNFVEHLGKERFYAAYVAYFSRYVMDHSPLEAFQHFFFSPAYNVRQPCNPCGATGQKKAKDPAMLSRLFSGLLHPFIHAAYGIEFGLPGQLAEGLAQAAVQRSEQNIFLPAHVFTELTNELEPKSGLVPDRDSHGRAYSGRCVFAVTPPKKYVHQYSATLKGVGPAVKALVREWEEDWLQGALCDADVEMRLVGMVEEVIWGNVIWFGVGGWTLRDENAGKAIDADFYVMHLVTSSIFLLTLILPSASTPSPTLLLLRQRLVLLRTYLAVSVSVYISRGRAQTPLPIEEFYVATQAHVVRVNRAGGVGISIPARDEHELAKTWESILSTAITHSDDHLPKMIRALAAFAARWGKRRASPGYYFAGHLPHSGRLDGTLFVRVAALVIDRFVRTTTTTSAVMSWALGEGEGEGGWDNISGDLP
ncbi:hypothetical protein B0F90DRAFT_1668214 [Multifurca ochricompacta]|uniref:Uncharacterized protein n=1 Tax=Multifurca ochricompacta TaxID=376703 RepID=A0AAD4M495_9AGAM|nr:hypothetical protein B0F90DRAFT_1668214 [Multifurca ochricompacta]